MDDDEDVVQRLDREFRDSQNPFLPDIDSDLNTLDGVVQDVRADDSQQLDSSVVEPLVDGASRAAGKAAPAQRPANVALPQTPSVPSVVDAWMKLNRKSGPSMPWETGIFSDPFQSSWKKPRWSPPVFGTQAALTSPSEGPSSSSASTSTTQVPDFAKKRLHIARLIRTDDHARWEALRKLKMLILLNPSSSELGRTLVASATLLRSDDQLGSSIIDSFSAKATGTLVKRAGALWRYAKYCATHNIADPLSSSESDLYSYMQYLKVHGAATSANDFIQSWRFLHHAVGLKCCPVDELISARVRGAADGMFSSKRKLVQAVPLTTKMVLALEKIVLMGPYPHWRLIAGHLLLCLGSSSRFADSIRLDHIIIEEFNGVYLIHASTTRERKARLLPILCLGRFFAREAWAPVWMRLRAEAGFGNDPSLNAFSEITSQWMTRAMSTGEASLFLQEFLIGSGFKPADLEGIATHSLKCTLLSYVAKGNYLPLPDRRALGHHLEAGDNSAITYSRDELSRLMVRVERMLQDIRAGDFRPDDRRVQRIAEQSGAVGRNDFLTEAEDGSEDSDDFGAADLERGPMGLEPGRTAFDDLTLEAVSSSLVHIHSGVLQSCMFRLKLLRILRVAERRLPTISHWKKHPSLQTFLCVSNAQSRFSDIIPYRKGKNRCGVCCVAQQSSVV